MENPVKCMIWGYPYFRKHQYGKLKDLKNPLLRSRKARDWWPAFAACARQQCSSDFTRAEARAKRGFFHVCKIFLSFWYKFLLEPQGQPFIKWMEMVSSNHFLYKDLGIIPLKQPFINGCLGFQAVNSPCYPLEELNILPQFFCMSDWAFQPKDKPIPRWKFFHEEFQPVFDNDDFFCYRWTNKACHPKWPRWPRDLSKCGCLTNSSNISCSVLRAHDNIRVPTFSHQQLIGTEGEHPTISPRKGFWEKGIQTCLCSCWFFWWYLSAWWFSFSFWWRCRVTTW